MSEGRVYWLVSLPLKHRESPEQSAKIVNEDKQLLLDYMSEKLVDVHPVCELYSMELSDFKVGTLDSLVLASDELAKLDPIFEATVEKLANHLKSLLDNDLDKLKSNLTVNEKSPDNYVKTFQWNRMKYRTDLTIAEISVLLSQEVTQVDNLVKVKLSSYSHDRSVMSAFERRKAGSLLIRDLSSLVSEKDFLQDSEYMQTVLVVVPTLAKDDWLSSYETLAAMVVPRSSKLIVEENDYALFSVTVFNKCLDEFQKNCSNNRQVIVAQIWVGACATPQGRQRLLPLMAMFVCRFTIREFKYNSEEIGQRKQEFEDLAFELQSQWANLVRLLKTNFGEVFSCWIHLKCLRLFVESVLRYGLPPDFLTLIIRPTRAEKKVRRQIIHCLEKLQLPGISQVDLAAAISEEGGRASSANGGAGGNANSVDDAAEEAELWNTLSLGGVHTYDPYVNFLLRWQFI